MSAASSPRPHRTASLVAGLIACLAAGEARACDVSLGPLISQPLSYDPFEVAARSVVLSTTVTLRDAVSCSVQVALLNGVAAPARRLTTGAGGLVLLPQVRTGDPVTLGPEAQIAEVALSAARPVAQVAWTLQISRDAVLSPGDYPIDVRAAIGATQTSPAAQVTGSVLVRSLPRAQVNIAGAAGAFASGSDAYTLGFGVLTTGAERTAFVQVRGNTSAVLSLSSRNRGRLRADPPADDAIDYVATLGGARLDLSGPTTVPVSPPLDVAGVALPLKVTIGDVGGRQAGAYSDVITIDISSR